MDRIENRVQKRLALLHQFAQKAFEIPDDEFIEFPDLPQDMVIYRYRQDTLQSWANQFPISSDDIQSFDYYHRINYLSSRGVTNIPLAYIREGESQYVSLGSAWYVVDRYSQGSTTVFAALLVQTDYHSDNTVLENQINPNLSVSKQLSIVPLTYDESYIVKGLKGEVLFSVLKKTPNYIGQTGIILRWLSIILVVFALFAFHEKRRGLRSAFITISGVILLRFFAVYLSGELVSELDLFSPSLYADFGYFDSFANLLIDNIFIFLIVSTLFMVRKRLAYLYYKPGLRKKSLLAAILFIIPLFIVPYIHLTLRSLILNSNIVLELNKIDEITIYSLFAYISYGLLFIALLFSLQLLRPIFRSLWNISFLRIKSIAIFIAIISIYTLLIVSYYSFTKEFDKNRVWTTKMSIDRDLNTEVQLISIEQFIYNDPTIIASVELENFPAIFSRLSEAYIWNILQRYDLKITVCREGDILENSRGGNGIDCATYFRNQVYDYGAPLYDGSNFFFMNRQNGRVAYFGAFTFRTFAKNVTLYLELESKYAKDAIGYPGILANNQQLDNNIPTNYSYSRYIKNRLVINNGKFNYPYLMEREVPIGYSVMSFDGYLHFVNKVSADNVIFISRPERSVFPYFVAFSYIVLFYTAMILGIIRIRHKSLLYSLPKYSFRRKITMLIISSLVFALISMGAGSIWFSLNYFNETTRAQMEEKLQSVQSTLSDFSKLSTNYQDYRFFNVAMFDAMTKLSHNAQIDINIYSPSGIIIRSTQMEMFEKYLLGYRINPMAFKEIVFNHKKRFVHKESIGDLTYYSLYAPIFNNAGNLIAIINIPYFSKQTDISKDASNIIATIINIYLILLLATLFGGVALSNSLSRPLAEISKKMQILDVNSQAEHIDYNNKDELGTLVAAYNKMVDDLEESTIRLAQSEREQAWREMARQIAHEIKNPLTPMRLSIQHLMRLKSHNVPDWPQKFDALANSLIEQIDILSEAASEFSSFSRFYNEDLTRIDLNRLIKEQIILFNTSDNIKVEFEPCGKEAIVEIRKSQITRVLVNLLSNAVQALEGNREGRVLVSVIREESGFILSVEDSGPGVPDTLTHRLFKPNFTTKSGGTGLGLAICRSIIEQSQGTISYARSQKLGGASFIIRLPRIFNTILKTTIS